MKILICLTNAVLSLSVSSVFAADQKSPFSKMDVSDARIFAPIEGSNATGGYGIFKNNSAQPLKLTLKKVSPFKAVELHETVEKDGMMAMVKVESFEIPANGSLELKPGGRHMMLFEPSHLVKAGESLTGTFNIGSADLEVAFKVIPRVQRK